MTWKELGIFILIIIGLYFFKFLFGNDPHIYIDDIRKSYSGSIVNKYTDRVQHLKVKVNSDILDPWPLTDSLWNFATIGDSIEKLPNDNYVYLFKNGRKIKIQYLYIDENYYNDFRWPKEWKGKWIIGRQ
jgi:hypothetical protein